MGSFWGWWQAARGCVPLAAGVNRPGVAGKGCSQSLDMDTKRAICHMILDSDYRDCVCDSVRLDWQGDERHRHRLAARGHRPVSVPTWLHRAQPLRRLGQVQEEDHGGKAAADKEACCLSTLQLKAVAWQSFQKQNITKTFFKCRRWTAGGNLQQNLLIESSLNEAEL